MATMAKNESNQRRMLHDRERKAKEYARKRIESKEGMLINSFQDVDNFFEAETRLNEMEALASGILGGCDGQALFTTFPNEKQRKEAGYEPGYDKETKLVGCVPVYLMASLLNEIKGEEKFKKIVEKGQEIGREPGKEQSVKERAYYFMLHWRKGKTGKWKEKMVDDWKRVDKMEHQIFSPMATAQIEKFGQSILKGLGLGRITVSTHTYAPGIVYTEGSFTQAAHIDFDETGQLNKKKSWILHMPLQREGLLLSVWDLPINKGKRNDEDKHKYMYVPFGAYIALRSDVLHSGCYGASGNVRFHMVLKSKNGVGKKVVNDSDKEDRDKEGKENLHYYQETRDKERQDWKDFFAKGRTKFDAYGRKYIDVLKRHTGGASDSYLECMKFSGGKKRKKNN
jgi:hypothetical protein